MSGRQQQGQEKAGGKSDESHGPKRGQSIIEEEKLKALLNNPKISVEHQS